MNKEIERFVRFVESRLDDFTDKLADESLVVAVFGPGVASDSLGGRKRKQIADTLQSDGHVPIMPEQFLDLHRFDLSWLEQEALLLAEYRIDFVIVLLTEDSLGAYVEIGRISAHPAIMEKTVILYPRRHFSHFSQKEYLTANTVASFPNLLYTEDEMETCQVVAKCRDWVSNEKYHVKLQEISLWDF